MKSIIAILLFLSLCGCAASRLDLSLDYQSEIPQATSPMDGVLGVDEFIDMRPRATTSDARKWLGFIPGVLWVEMISEIPDAYTAFAEYSPGPFSMAFAHSIYKDISRRGVFRETVFLPKDRYVKIDYRLEGILNKTYVKETGYYYGSGLYAWVTRIVGLPYVSYDIEIDLTLRLRRLDTNEIIWTHDIKDGGSDRYYNVYGLSSGKEGKNVISYNIARMLDKNMSSAMLSMRAAVEANGSGKQAAFKGGT